MKERVKEAYEFIIHRRKPSKFLDLVKKDPVVDIGCGAGYNCSKLKGYVIGLDIAEKQLIESKKRGCENLVQADMEFLPFRDNSISTILCLATLHHLPDPSLAISEMYRVLKVGGEIIVTVWLVQFKFLFRRNVWLISNFNGRKLYRFYRFYFPWELRKIMEKFGFLTIENRVFRLNSFLPNNVMYHGKKILQEN
ncbi:MAG: class I SAM-dependent methyltransferase [Sulfolobaceae archaeon]